VTLLERALDLAERGRGTTHPNPIVGAVIERDGEVVGEGWHERAGGPHAEIVALEQAGESARGAAMYVTLEPCAHHGRTPPCADAVLAAGIARVVVGASDPDPRTDGRGITRLREAGVEVEVLDDPRARRQNEAWRTWARLGRPFVTLKLAATLDGRVAIPGSGWITGEESRRLVHELRAASDAVAVGMGTVRADRPALTARGVGATRQPRRLAFGRGPLPQGIELELVDGPIAQALRRLASDDVQSLLLEGGPTLATSFLREDLVDKVLLFVAPTVAGEGPAVLAAPVGVIRMHDVTTSRHGDDVLLTAYVHEP
jgi:diaminohydroxyphosphoribosylaminopyrimidine deaminase / 5-amino-6-(5-phosphoribosylamino)uracil reductase